MQCVLVSDYQLVKGIDCIASAFTGAMLQSNSHVYTERVMSWA